MGANRIAMGAGSWLTASGVAFLVGAVIHPHAPEARDMAEVAYTQTGQIVWWPAHLALLFSYILFAVFLFNLSRVRELPSQLRHVLNWALPVAAFCVLAMLVHLLLPLGRESVSNSQQGWALWAKDIVESADAAWALCVAAVAWSFGRAHVVGNRLTAVLGAVGGLGFAVFSFAVPLTGVVLSMQFTRSVLQVVPVAALLLTAWAVVAGLLVLFRRDGPASSAEREIDSMPKSTVPRI